jgi:hypothetical protein
MRFPNWFKELVRRFNLMQFSSAKYCEGVEMLGWHRFIEDDRACDWQDAAEFKSAPAEVAPPHAAAMADYTL